MNIYQGKCIHPEQPVILKEKLGIILPKSNDHCHTCMYLCVQAILSGKVKCEFKGVALGDSWISPIGEICYQYMYVYKYIVMYCTSCALSHTYITLR